MVRAYSCPVNRNLFSILVVDDDEASRYAMARALRAAGYETMEAASGAQALELAEYASAVILDLYLPDLLGCEVCRLLRARATTATLPVFQVTAKGASDDDKAHSLACGANLFWEAPVATEILIAELDKMLSPP